MIFSRYLSFLWISFYLVLISCTAKESKEASLDPIMDKKEEQETYKKEQLSFYFTPSLRNNLLDDNINDLVNFLAQETGYSIKPVIPKDSKAMISDFVEGRADLGIMNTLGFIEASGLAPGLQARLKVIRYGLDHYKGQIITHIDSGIDELDDLNGKTFAFTSKNSTSGYLFPAKMLMDQGVRLSKTFYAEKHDKVAEIVYRRMADAGATFYSAPGPGGEARDARAKILKKYPDVLDKLKIISITEPIPNDPVVFSAQLPGEVVRTLIEAMIKYAGDIEGKKVLIDLYGTEGFIPCQNGDYAPMAEAIKKSAELQGLIEIL